MFKQLFSYFKDIFSKRHLGFRKGFNTEQCLLPLLGKWKNVVHKDKIFGALLTDLSKAYHDYLNHELLIAKLDAYNFALPTLKLIHNYLSNIKQKGRSK